MTKEEIEEAISLLTQVHKILVNSNSWLENTHEPLNMAFDMAIKALEQTRWIPVSEELPDKEGYYLCSVRYMYPPYNFFEPEKVKYMDDVTIQKFDGEFNIEVKAWMPLPPCYKPQESEEV